MDDSDNTQAGHAGPLTRYTALSPPSLCLLLSFCEMGEKGSGCTPRAWYCVHIPRDRVGSCALWARTDHSHNTQAGPRRATYAYGTPLCRRRCRRSLGASIRFDQQQRRLTGEVDSVACAQPLKYLGQKKEWKEWNVEKRTRNTSSLRPVILKKSGFGKKVFFRLQKGLS